MGISRWVLVISFLVISGAWADADYSLISDLTGSYSLLSTDSSARAGGVIEIRADDSGVGFVITPLKLASEPAAPYASVTPKMSTTLERNGNVLTQSFISNASTVTTTYQKFDGYVVVGTHACDGVSCLEKTFTYTTGKAPGVPEAARDFIATVAGAYKILSAGGEAPTDINSGASVDLDSDAGMADIWAPYCLSTGVCDPGEVAVPYAQTLVFKNVISANDEIFTILITKNNKLLHYSWENKLGQSVFRNFQYNLSGTPVCLEHVYVRS